MKKTLIAMFALAGVAMADSDLLKLPASTSLNSGSDLISNICTSGNALPLLETVKGYDAGVHVGLNSGTNVSLTTDEGKWVNTDNVGSMTLAGRGGAWGESFAIIVKGSDLTSTLTTGTHINTLTFSFDIPTFADIDTGEGKAYYNYGIGVYDKDGNSVKVSVSNPNPDDVNEGRFYVTKTTPPTTLSLEVEDFDWDASYTIAAVVKGVKGSNGTSTYTISNVKLSYSATAPVVPEPATATLSLLALAGLAARRRRH